MLKPAEIAPASGPTITADAALLRDRTTGRFAPTDGRGRSAAEREAIADRWARVAELYPHKTEREIADELEWSPATIAKDVRALAALGIIEQIRQPGARRKYPDAKERPCDGCGKLFTPENWELDRRYHSPRCAQANNRSELVRETARKLKTESRRRADAEIARLNEAGYLTSRQLAAERKVTESVVSSWIARGMLKAERRIIEGEPQRIIARDELDRFNAEEWPRILERMGPNFPSNWRGPRRRLWSRRLRAPTVGKLGGVKARYDPDQERRVRAAKAAFPTWGPITISRVVSRATGKPLTPYQVRGILEKKPA